jgi:hypothetical protein
MLYSNTQQDANNKDKNISVWREPPFREDLDPGAEDYPLLEAVTRQLLVKTLRAGKALENALVNCKVWKSATAL